MLKEETDLKMRANARGENDPFPVKKPKTDGGGNKPKPTLGGPKVDDG